MFYKKNSPHIFKQKESFLMLNTIWFLLIFLGIIYSLFSGNLQEINNAILKEAEAGVLFSINLIGIMSFWLGVMNIAEK